MIERKGVWGRERDLAADRESDIRKWAIAVYWPKPPPPIFWDAEYAAAPAGAASSPRPTSTPSPGRDRRAPRPVRSDPNTPRAGKGRRGMNGGQVDTYGVPMRPGDVITARNRLRDWDERETRLGLTLFTLRRDRVAQPGTASW